MNNKRDGSIDDRDFLDRISEPVFGTVVNYEDLTPEDKKRADRDLAYYESIKDFLSSFKD